MSPVTSKQAMSKAIRGCMDPMHRAKVCAAMPETWINSHMPLHLPNALHSGESRTLIGERSLYLFPAHTPARCFLCSLGKMNDYEHSVMHCTIASTSAPRALLTMSLEKLDLPSGYIHNIQDLLGLTVSTTSPQTRLAALSLVAKFFETMRKQSEVSAQN